jgi:putative inorganic carbon (HCO3(-)) transporter
MRDLLLLMIIAPSCIVALRYPFVGAMVYTWFSLMNPHRLTFGFMYDAPSAMALAICTIIGVLATQEKRSPFVGAPIAWFAILLVWMGITTALAIHPDGSFTMYEKVLKINLMVFITLMVVRTKREIMVLAWICAFSVAYYGIKGGLFTVMTGGAHRVYGPYGSYIQENNALAVALITVIPLMRFLQTTLHKTWQKYAMTAAMLFCGFSVLGSHSRGALLAISAMVAVLWWRGTHKLRTGFLILVVGGMALASMPQEWWDRMDTIENHEQDRSAMGRLNAWEMAYNIAKARPTGGGYSIYRADVYARFAPDPSYVVSAHSVYFHMLGEHGFFGLFLYLMMGLSTWMTCASLRRLGRQHPEAEWCYHLGSMLQVSLVGFAVGAAFLSLTYYDLPYYLMAIAVAARVWVSTRGWEREPAVAPPFKVMGVPVFLGDRLRAPSMSGGGV